MCFEAPSCVVGTEKEVTTGEASLLFPWSLHSMPNHIRVMSINDLVMTDQVLTAKRGAQ